MFLIWAPIWAVDLGEGPIFIMSACTTRPGRIHEHPMGNDLPGSGQEPPQPEKWWTNRQWNHDFPNCFWKVIKLYKIPNHQPGTQKIWLRTPRNMSFLWKVSWDSCYRVTSGIGSPCFRCWCVLWFVSLLRPFRYGSGNQRRVLTAKLGLSSPRDDNRMIYGHVQNKIWKLIGEYHGKYGQSNSISCYFPWNCLVFFPVGSPDRRLIHQEV